MEIALILIMSSIKKCQKRHAEFLSENCYTCARRKDELYSMSKEDKRFYDKEILLDETEDLKICKDCR